MTKERGSLNRIEKAIKKEKKDIKHIERKVSDIKKEISRKEPPHFSKKDIVHAFFGALIIGLTFVFKGKLIDVVSTLSGKHIVLIIASTLVILSTQIYFIRYTKVKDKKHRHFLQFLMKRIVTLYIIALIVSFYLVYIFHIEYVVGNFMNAFKLVIVISMPCAIGAAIPGLFKQD